MPPVPRGCEALWDAFNEMAHCAGNNGFSRNPVGWQDIAAWQAAHHLTLSGWEAATVIAIDQAVLAAQQSKTPTGEQDGP